MSGIDPFVPRPPSSTPTFSKYLILPTISKANVPQLAIDLVIHTLSLPLLGYLNDDLLYPFAGPRDTPLSTPLSEMGGICCPLEVFGNEKITVVQQRSPVLPHRKLEFVQNIVSPFITRYGFEEILVLGSADAARRNDAQLMTPLVYLSPQASPDETPSSNSREDTESEVAVSEIQRALGKLSLKPVSPYPRLHGAGMTFTYLETAMKERWNLSLICMFVFEGDNGMDAEYLASVAFNAFSLPLPVAEDATRNIKMNGKAGGKGGERDGRNERGWITPRSWDGVYGKQVEVGPLGGMFW